jgi:MFS family permease
VLLAATASVFASVGLGRFALGMLLPSMGTSLDLSYAEMGFISTGNFLGYLTSAMAVGRLAARFGERRLIVAGLLVVVLSMALIGLAEGVGPLLFLYTLTGLGSGAAFVAAVALVPQWFARRFRGWAIGFVLAGNGLAIMFSGWLIPLVNAEIGAEGWRVGWGILSAVSLALAGLCQLSLRRRPAESNDLAPAASTAPRPETRIAARPGERRLTAHLGAIYFLFGLTYVIYITFIVTALVKDHGLSEIDAGHFWIWLGFLSLFSGPLFGGLSDRFGRKLGMILVFSLQFCAYLLAAGGGGVSLLYLSVAMFGISAWSIPTIITAALADNLSPERVAGAMGAVTFAFGAGQMIGPSAAGVVAELSGSFTASYLLAAALVGLAIAATFALKRPPTAP